MKPMYITEEKINYIRDEAKRLGIWDKDYSTIKKDLDGIKNNLITMNLSYDMAGVLAEKTILALRLLTYGESRGDVSLEECEAIMAPLDDMSIYTEQSFLKGSDASGVELTFHIFPACFEVIQGNREKITDRTSLERALRMMLISFGKLQTVFIGIAIGMDYCLNSYGMNDLRNKMIVRLTDTLDKNRSEHIDTLIEASKRIFGKRFDIPLNKFSVLLSIVLGECNSGDMDHHILYDIIYDMRSEIIKRGHKRDFLEFLDSNGFREFSLLAISYHGVDKLNDDDDNEEDNGN